MFLGRECEAFRRASPARKVSGELNPAGKQLLYSASPRTGSVLSSGGVAVSGLGAGPRVFLH